MNSFIIYGIIFVILLILELAYFKIAVRFNIVDRPNERSSHSTIVLRGGGIIFLLGIWVWSTFFGFEYPWMLAAVTVIAGVSFIDDIHSLPDSTRLVAQFAAMIMMFYQLGLFDDFSLVDGISINGVLIPILILILALIVCVGASNVINFMDGINGITGAYVIASILPLFLLNRELGFVSESLIVTVAIADVVFCIFNFRPRGKAKCFAGDVGSICIAYILLFLIGSLVLMTGDVTYFIFLLVYGVDGVLTICHRILLRENIGQPHRKHAYQLMANELKMSHMTVSAFYLCLQLAVSLGFIYLSPILASALNISIVAGHWIFLIVAFVVLTIAYVLFMKKYYHLHEEYLASLIK